jgi:hypothetical protein
MSSRLRKLFSLLGLCLLAVATVSAEPGIVSITSKLKLQYLSYYNLRDLSKAVRDVQVSFPQKGTFVMNLAVSVAKNLGVLNWVNLTSGTWLQLYALNDFKLKSTTDNIGHMLQAMYFDDDLGVLFSIWSVIPLSSYDFAIIDPATGNRIDSISIPNVDVVLASTYDQTSKTLFFGGVLHNSSVDCVWEVFDVGHVKFLEPLPMECSSSVPNSQRTDLIGVRYSPVTNSIIGFSLDKMLAAIDAKTGARTDIMNVTAKLGMWFGFPFGGQFLVPLSGFDMDYLIGVNMVSNVAAIAPVKIQSNPIRGDVGQPSDIPMLSNIYVLNV